MACIKPQGGTWCRGEGRPQGRPHAGDPSLAPCPQLQPARAQGGDQPKAEGPQL